MFWTHVQTEQDRRALAPSVRVDGFGHEGDPANIARVIVDAVRWH